MTSRRNFVIGAGSLLTGSGAFLGSGAFGLSSSDQPEQWVPVGVRTLSSEGVESSVGMSDEGGDQQPNDGAGEDDDTDDGGDDPDDGEDQDDDNDRNDEERDDEDDDRDDDDDDDDRDPEPSGETSVRLVVDHPDALDSEHVLADGNGALQGIRLRDANMNALTYVGETADGRFPNPPAGDRVAFLVVNDGDVAVDLRVDLEGAAPKALNFPAWVDAAVRGPRQRDLTGVVVEELPPGGVVHAVVELDTTVVDALPADAVEEVTFVADPV
jgi:hypothetical protein